ncbi:hypothetical protein [Plantactinospora sp. CA-290183]|uniref:hypothetical protein n=1 Tax=Plantactinospora sp. CA-290183 TaxID=3240006 RepID=UPI003D8CDDE3
MESSSPTNRGTGPSRRGLLRGLAASLATGCVTSGGDDTPAAAKGETSPENPLGAPEALLEPAEVIFGAAC